MTDDWGDIRHREWKRNGWERALSPCKKRDAWDCSLSREVQMFPQVGASGMPWCLHAWSVMSITHLLVITFTRLFLRDMNRTLSSHHPSRGWIKKAIATFLSMRFPSSNQTNCEHSSTALLHRLFLVHVYTLSEVILCLFRASHPVLRENHRICKQILWFSPDPSSVPGFRMLKPQQHLTLGLSVISPAPLRFTP